MPLYEYECKDCGNTTEEVFKLADYPIAIPCPHCASGMATKIISLSSVHGEEALWIDKDLNNALVGPGDRPITTRTEYKQFMKNNPEIEPTS